MPEAELHIQYSTSNAFASQMIRRLCHSPFSHVDIILEGEGLLGASGPDNYVVDGKPWHDPGGVIVRPFHPWPYLYDPVIARVRTTVEVRDKVIAQARSQINKPFDNSALWEFLSDKPPGDRDWKATDKWFCSELVTWAEETAGMFPWPLVVPKSRISPADNLMINMPMLINPDEVCNKVMTLRGQLKAADSLSPISPMPATA